jgi:hypothetical protein
MENKIPKPIELAIDKDNISQHPDYLVYSLVFFLDICRDKYLFLIHLHHEYSIYIHRIIFNKHNISAINSYYKVNM